MIRPTVAPARRPSSVGVAQTELAQPKLRRDLSQRHVTMIAFGGIIGGGLFVGTGASIAAVGPAIVVSYLLASVIILLIMRMLSEMATATPGLGVFTEYVRQGLGDGAGFVAGWLYWYFWVIVVGIEAIAGAVILQTWLPLPTWALGTALVLVMTGVNLLSARSYGEFEFWFATVKVAAIVAFIAVVGGWLLFTPPPGDRFANLHALHGFAPKGWVAVLAGVPSTIFVLCGAEIATVAAAESRQPARVISSLTYSIVSRIVIFYLLSLFLIVTVLPWTQVRPGVSPFAQTLARIGVPGAAEAMTVVVLTAVLSCLNSGLYVTSRVLLALAVRREAPAAVAGLNRAGAPALSILLGGAGGLLAVLCSILSPNGLFAFLVNASGATMLMIYLLVAAAQIHLRRRTPAGVLAPEVVRMWGFPGLSYLTLAVMTAALLAMAIIPTLAPQLYASVAALVVAVGAWLLVCAMRRRRVLIGS